MRQTDEQFFEQHCDRYYRSRHASVAEVEARLPDGETPVLPEGMRFFVVVKRGYCNVPVAMIVIDRIDADADRTEEAYREIFDGAFPRRPSLCVDCGNDTAPSDEHDWPIEGTWEHYDIQDEVWLAAGMPHDSERTPGGGDFLCIGCLEARIGRTLTPRDFTDAGINRPSDLKSPRLRSRLTGESA